MDIKQLISIRSLFETWNNPTVKSEYQKKAIKLVTAGNAFNKPSGFKNLIVKEYKKHKSRDKF